MKNIFQKCISLFLILGILFTSSPFTLAVHENIKTELSKEYRIYDEINNGRNTIYYVSEKDRYSTRSFWDIVDFAMAGWSWADFFNEPSWGNFGWAVLDTAAIAPLVPSSGWVRRNGKMYLKEDAAKQLAKTHPSSVKNALKVKIGNFYFNPTAAKHMNDASRRVPSSVLGDAIKYGKPGYDSMAGYNAYYIRITKNGKNYNLKVVYSHSKNTIQHFHYTSKAIGPLSATK